MAFPSEQHIEETVRQYTRGRNYGTFLEENLFLLTNRIIVDDFFPYLRSKGVIADSDVEVIERKYFASASRAMELIDRVKKRGVKAFYYFMDWLQYTNPDTFQAMTKMAPRDPPEDDPRLEANQRRKTLSGEIMEKMAEYIKKLNTELTTKKTDFNNLLETMKEEEARLRSAHEALYGDLIDQKQKCDELEESNRRLEQEKQQLEREKEEALHKRDHYLRRYNTARTRTREPNVRAKRVAMSDSESTESARNSAEDTDHKAIDMAEDGTDDTLEETVALHQDQLGEAQNERDAVQQKYRQLEEEYSKVKVENSRLRAALSRLNNEVMTLDHELSLAKGMTTMRPRAGPVPRQNPPTPDDRDEDGRYEGLYETISCDIDDSQFSFSEDETEPNSQPTGTAGAQTDSKSSRFGISRSSHKPEETLGKRRRPVVLMGPERVRDTLVKELIRRRNFVSCEKTVVKQCHDEWLATTTFHYEQQGDSFICLEKANLQAAVSKFQRVLLAIPWDAVIKLHQWNLHVVIVLIKDAEATEADRAIADEAEFAAVPKVVRDHTEKVDISSAEPYNMDDMIEKVMTAISAVDVRDKRSSGQHNSQNHPRVMRIS